MQCKFITFFFLFSLFTIFFYSQTIKERGYFRIVFYNVENYFDIYDDPEKNDNEFTPNGLRKWTYDKYKKKQKRIYKVLTAIGEEEMPEIVGLCEVENCFVLKELINNTPLKKYNYNYVHYESPDKRGIDVAFLYREDKFKVISSKNFRIIFEWDTLKKTRDILYVLGHSISYDTIHFFVNHWPSKLGGKSISEPYRIKCAQILRSLIDSIFSLNSNAYIIIMGDFNDNPTSQSITQHLKAIANFNDIKDNEIYNLGYVCYMKNKYSVKHDDFWDLIDLFFVSGTLLNKKNNIYTFSEAMNVFDADFLLEVDESNFGYKPKRTYIGYKYNDGFSDHLPIYLDIFKKN